MMKKQWKVILGFVLVLIIVIFAVLNSQDVPVSFGFISFRSPLILVIIGSALIGALVVFLTSSANLFQQKREIKNLNKEKKEFEENREAQIKTATEKIQVEHENEIKTLTANYESLLKERDAEIEGLKTNGSTVEKKQEPLKYYD